MESVPGAVATGLALASGVAATNDRFRTRLCHYPVATAPGTDLIPQTKTLPWARDKLTKKLPIPRKNSRIATFCNRL